MMSYPRIRILGLQSFMGSFKATSFLYKYLRPKTKAFQLGLLESSPCLVIYTEDFVFKCDLVLFFLQPLYLSGFVACVSRFCPAQVLIGEALWNPSLSHVDPTKILSKSDKR